MLRDHICIYMVKRVATRDIVPLWVRVSLFLYIKILVSGQENIIYEKTMKYHKEWIFTINYCAAYVINPGGMGFVD